MIQTIQSGIPIARIELLDEVQMDALNRYSKFDYPLMPTLFLEFHGTQAGVKEQAEMVQASAADNGGSGFAWATDAEARSRLWQARHDALWADLALRPGSQAFPTDVCVPISALAQCIRETKRDLEQSFLQAPLVGHVWDGNFHVVMLVDHMPIVFPGTFALLSVAFSPFGYVSVAEGFVFLSGFVSALVYTRVGRERGNRAMWHKILVRAGDIYLCYVLAVVALLALAKGIGVAALEWGSWTDLVFLPLPVASAKVAALLYQPMFLEILPMYSLFLLATPLILRQLEKGRYVVVAVVSLSIWVAAQYGIRGLLLRLWPHNIEIQVGYFNSWAWQILFVSGLICGHKTYTSKTRWLPAGWKLPALTYVFAVALFALRQNLVGINVNYRLVDRSSLGPLRLFNFACVTFLICSGRGVIEKLIAWRGFALLSRHSLQVFAFHLFPFYFLAVFMGSRRYLPVWAQVLAVGFCIVSLFGIAVLARLFKDARLRIFSKRQVGSKME